MEPYREAPPEEGLSPALIEIANYQSAMEAETNRALLVARGIRAFVDEPAAFNPLLLTAAGGARLLVSAADEGRARAILSQASRPSPEVDDDDEGEVRCPRCELSYCFHERSFLRGSPAVAAVTLVFVIPALLAYAFGRKRWRCHKCLHVWDDPKEGPARVTRLGPDDPVPVFRLRRGNGISGFFAGSAAASLIVLVGFGAFGVITPPVVWIAFACPVIGTIVGMRRRSDVCSAPGCRARLAPTLDTCPQCRGAIAGVIRAAHEHYAEAAEFRRDLADLHRREEARDAAEKRAAPRKLKKAKKPKKPKPDQETGEGGM